MTRWQEPPLDRTTHFGHFTNVNQFSWLNTVIWLVSQEQLNLTTQINTVVWMTWMRHIEVQAVQASMSHLAPGPSYTQLVPMESEEVGSESFQYLLLLRHLWQDNGGGGSRVWSVGLCTATSSLRPWGCALLPTLDNMFLCCCLKQGCKVAPSFLTLAERRK